MGTAPDDLATKIMTTADPEIGETFEIEEMVDQVAIFFLAGHETSGSALAWALYLMACYPEWQEKVTDEAQVLTSDQFGLIFICMRNDCPMEEAIQVLSATSSSINNPWAMG